MFEHLRGLLIEAAKAERPREMVGVIRDGVFTRLENIHEQPEIAFRLSDADTLQFIAPTGLQALVHSHPTSHFDGAFPSMIDQTQQQAMGVPWVLVAFEQEHGQWKYIEMGDHMLDSPILGQTFVYGVHDCYQLVRKWHWQNRQRKLLWQPSEYGWWANGEDLYRDNYEAYGFRRFAPVTPKDLKPGDMFFYPLGGASVYNHAGLYAGDGKILQHARGTISREYNMSMFPKINFWMRHVEEGG